MEKNNLFSKYCRSGRPGGRPVSRSQDQSQDRRMRGHARSGSARPARLRRWRVLGHGSLRACLAGSAEPVQRRQLRHLLCRRTASKWHSSRRSTTMVGSWPPRMRRRIGPRTSASWSDRWIPICTISPIHRPFGKLHHPDNYTVPQSLAGALRDKNSNGLLCRSVRYPDSLAVALFWPDVAGYRATGAALLLFLGRKRGLQGQEPCLR